MLSKDAAPETSPHLSFQLADEEYAVPVSRVREIIEYDTVTRVPSTPAWIRGVINLRGGVVPVVDLGLRLGLPERAVTKRSCMVILELTLDGAPALVGVTVDAVSQVEEIRAQDVEAVPAFGTRLRVDCLLGMARHGKKFVLLLDIDRVLADDALLSAAAQPEPPSEAAAEAAS